MVSRLLCTVSLLAFACGTPPAAATASASASVIATDSVTQAPAPRPHRDPLLPMFTCSYDVCATVKAVATFELRDWEVSLLNTSRVGPAEMLPTVVRGASWMVLDLTTTKEETHTLGWVAATLLDDKRTIIGLLDDQVEAAGTEIIVATSSDAGETWRRRAKIDKPHYLAVVREVTAASAKAWTITVDLDDCAGCGVKIGVYKSTTADAGATFSPFTLEQ